MESVGKGVGSEVRDVDWAPSMGRPFYLIAAAVGSTVQVMVCMCARLGACLNAAKSKHQLHSKAAKSKHQLHSKAYFLARTPRCLRLTFQAQAEAHDKREAGQALESSLTRHKPNA